MGGAKSVQ